ncbi:MAG: YdcF family protein [Marivibrio sp.]|uniref:YdcF family protein n=1 Tax=Marivibrio sp. TaxID=2039719 RepID=UPI0032EBAB0C
MDWYALAKDAFQLVAPNAPYWLLLGLAIAVWLRERRRRRVAAPGARRAGMSLIGLLGGTAVALTLLSAPAGPKLAALALTPKGPSADADAPAPDGRTFIALFSGGIWRGPDDRWRPSSASVARSLRAIDLASRTGLPLVLSGGRVPADAPPEADVIRERLRFPADLHVDRTARNTFENAQAFSEIAARLSWTRAVVATDAAHLRRAAACLRAAGVDVVAYLPTRPFPKLTPADAIPSVFGLAAWRAPLREAAGLAYYLAVGRIGWSDL